MLINWKNEKKSFRQKNPDAGSVLWFYTTYVT